MTTSTYKRCDFCPRQEVGPPGRWGKVVLPTRDGEATYDLCPACTAEKLYGWTTPFSAAARRPA